MYYERNEYVATFIPNNGESNTTYTLKYGATLTAPTVTKTGYTFNSWSPVVPSTMPAEDVTFEASWDANTDTAYKVEYYKDNVLVETSTRTGVTDTIASVTEADKNMYEGYTFDTTNANNVLSGTIAGDESLVLKVYYTINEQTYTVNHYILGTTDKISPSETKTTLYNTTINGIDEKKDNIEGYMYNSVDPETLTIGVSNEENIINIYYTAVNGNVKVMYIDESNNELADSDVLTGRVGTEYSTRSKEISKYKLLRVDGIEDGKYIDGEIVVSYVYEAIPNTGINENSISVFVPLISMLSLATLVIFKKKLYNK